MTRLEAIRNIHQCLIVNSQGIEGVNQVTAQLAVWSVHEQKMAQAAIICERRGVWINEAELYELGTLFMNLWGINEPRSVRSRCFICTFKLPLQEELLCHCFRVGQVGLALEPTWDSIEYLQQQYGYQWRDYPMERLQCKHCFELFAIPAGRIAAALRKGRLWEPGAQPLCQPCHQRDSVRSSKSTPPQARQSERPPSQRPSERPTLGQALVTSEKLESLKSLVATVSLPPVGES